MEPPCDCGCHEEEFRCEQCCDGSERMRTELQRLRSALKSARLTIHDEFCSGEFHSPSCKEIVEALWPETA